MDTIYTLKYFRRNYVTFVLVFFFASRSVYFILLLRYTHIIITYFISNFVALSLSLNKKKKQNKEPTVGKGDTRRK